MFSEWGAWSDCNLSCGISNDAGIRVRHRNIEVQPKLGGMSCHDSKQEILPCVHCATKPPGYDGTCIRVCPGIITTVEAPLNVISGKLIIGFM